MALIKCPECGKEISDRAKQCIHCGYPLDENINENNEINEILSNINNETNKVICNILGEDYDLTFLDEFLKQGKYYQLFLNSSKIKDGYFAKHDMKVLTYLWHYIDEHDEIPNEITQQSIDSMKPTTNLDLMRRWKQWEINPSIKAGIQLGQIVCPRCGSTSITTGQRGFSIITGFIGSNKTVNRCANCGNTWTPKG